MASVAPVLFIDSEQSSNLPDVLPELGQNINPVPAAAKLTLLDGACQPICAYNAYHLRYNYSYLFPKILYIKTSFGRDNLSQLYCSEQFPPDLLIFFSKKNLPNLLLLNI